MTGPRAQHRTALASVHVVGAGLIGASLGLALRGRDVEVSLTDRRPTVARRAAELGAGTAGLPATEPDLVVAAVPVEVVGTALAPLARRYRHAVFTDVASTKAGLLFEIETIPALQGRFVGGHPMAGSERSGPAAARADLFAGRPWAITPLHDANPVAFARTRELAGLCGAVPVVLSPVEHDDAVAVVSHLPHLLAAAAAAQLTTAPEVALQLAGQGVRDVTRVAGSDPALWQGILRSNAGPLAAVLRAVLDDLGRVADALSALSRAGDTAEAERIALAPQPQDVLLEFLSRGRQGRQRLPDQPAGSRAAD